MSNITTYPLRKPQQFFGQDCLVEKIAHEAIEHARIEAENAILRERIAQHEAIEKLRAAQLERADRIQTTQRLRIDEMSKLNTEYCSEIERLEETVSKLRAELTEVLGAGGLEILIAETGQ